MANMQLLPDAPVLGVGVNIYRPRTRGLYDNRSNRSVRAIRLQPYFCGGAAVHPRLLRLIARCA